MAELYSPSLKHPPPANLSTSRQFTGDGPPNDNDGNNGDEYIDQLNGFIYTKSNGVWTSQK